MDACGHSVKSYINSLNTYSRKIISHSKTNYASKNMVLQWVPRWHSHSANIFMGSLEQALLSSSPSHLIPLLWKRFIDDIFLIWTHGEESFLSFIQYLNSFHQTIKFKVTHSTTSVDFLDTTIYITSQNTLQSTLYIKPTDRMPLLHETSHLPV